MSLRPPRWLTALLVSLPAFAGYPLRTLPKEVILNLRPFAERGEVVLIESNKDGTLKQLALVALVKAPREKMWHAIAATEEYPKFVPNVLMSKTKRQVGQTRWVDWELEIPLFNIRGTNAYRFHAPDAMDVETASGDLKTGAWRWELFSLDEKNTLAVEYAYSDVRDLNFVMRKLIKRNKYVEHGSVLSAATVFMKAAKARAEKLAGTRQQERPDPKSSPKIELSSLRQFASDEDFAALSPLFDRGVVAFVGSLPDGRLHQAVLAVRTYVPPKQVYEVAAHPDLWDDFMPGVRDAYAISDKGNELTYRMEIAAPLISIDFRARLQRGPDWLRTKTLDGDLKNAQFAWEFLPLGNSRSVAFYYVNSDLRRSSWVVRQLIDRDPFFEHGINVAAGLLTIQMVRGRAEGWLAPKKRG